MTAGLGDSNALEDSLSGKRWLRLKVAKAALAAARLSRADAQRTLELGVKTAYINAVHARDTLDFALQVQTGANQIFQLNQTRYNAGAISEADLAKVETMKLEADQAVDGAEEALRAAKVQLAFLLGVRGRVPQFHIDQDLPKFFVPAPLAHSDVEALLGEAIDHRPDLKAMGFQRDRAAAAIALAKRDRFPDLSLNVQYSQQAGTTNLAAQPPTVSFGLIGTLPLFYFQQGEIKKAEADYRTQQLQRAKVQAQLVADVEGAYNAFASSRKLVERMEGRLLDRAKRARDLVSLQYQKGAASLLEYLDAQRTFIAEQRGIPAGPRQLLDRRLSARSGDRDGSTMKSTRSMPAPRRRRRRLRRARVERGAAAAARRRGVADAAAGEEREPRGAAGDRSRRRRRGGHQRQGDLRRPARLRTSSRR